MLTSKISSKGQTTIPHDVREALNLSSGDRLSYEIKDGKVILHPLTGNIFDHAGTVKPSSKPEDFKHVRNNVKSALAERTEGKKT